MDFIKGNEQVKIDPSGIDISGAGHIIIDSNSVTGDITFNNKINMNAKVTVSDNLNIIGDLSMNGIIDMCGNVRFDDTYVENRLTQLTSDGTWYIDSKAGGGWTMMKNLPPLSNIGFNESNSGNGTFTQDEGTESFTEVFGRPTSHINFTPDEVLFTTITSDGQRVWWILDYTKADTSTTTIANANGWAVPSSNAGAIANNGGWLESTTIIKSSSANVSHITHVHKPNNDHLFYSSIYFNEGVLNPVPWDGGSVIEMTKSFVPQFPVYSVTTATSPTDYNHYLRYYQGMSIFFRDSTNSQSSPKPYPILIKKEPDHLHITAPLSIYSEDNNELDKLGFDGNIDLQYDNYYGSSNYGQTIDNSGGWYIVRQTYQPTVNHEDDNFHFMINYGSYITSNLNIGNFYSRNVSDYDYDEVLFWEETGKRWLIFDRNTLESFTTSITSNGNRQVGVKKSSLSPIPHPIYSNPDIADLRPHIFYSNRDGDQFVSAAETGGRTWTERSADFTSTQVQGIRKYYVRRADGQPVRLKNKVKVDVDGNLDVDGNITCSNIGIGTSNPKYNAQIISNTDTCTLHLSNYNRNTNDYSWLQQDNISNSGVQLVSKVDDTAQGSGYLMFNELSNTNEYGKGITHGFAVGYRGGTDEIYNWPGNSFNIARFNGSADSPTSSIRIKRTGEIGIGDNVDAATDVHLKGTMRFEGTGGYMDFNSAGNKWDFVDTDGTDSIFYLNCDHNQTTMIGNGTTGMLCTKRFAADYGIFGSNARDSSILDVNSTTGVVNGPTLYIKVRTYDVDIPSSMHTDGTVLYDSHHSGFRSNSAEHEAQVHTNDGNPAHVWYSADYQPEHYEKGDKISNNSSSEDHNIRSCAHFGGSITIEGAIYLESDKRVKNNIIIIDDSIALDAINDIQCYSYYYNDFINRKITQSFGFMAQEVKSKIPSAVELKKDFLPSIMKFAKNFSWENLDNGKYKITIPNLLNDLSDNEIVPDVGTRFKFYLNDKPTTICIENEVIAKLNEDRQSFIFNKKMEYVFIYGYEVNDFHILDKEKLFVLHHSGIQELSRRNDKLQEDNNKLQKDNDTKTSKIASLESRVEALEEAILAMQSLIQGLQ